jgi:hypothetical protein
MPTPALTDVTGQGPFSGFQGVLPDEHDISSRHAGWGRSRWIDLPVVFCLYVNEMLSHSHHAELALYTDNTAIISTSGKPTLLASYLES